MYFKFPNDFLIPVKSVSDLIDDLDIENLRTDKNEDVEKEITEVKEELSIEEGLKDIKDKKMWEEIDEEYAESQLMK